MFVNLENIAIVWLKFAQVLKSALRYSRLIVECVQCTYLQHAVSSRTNCICSPPQFQIFTTSTTSIADYFAQKMAKLKNKPSASLTTSSAPSSDLSDDEARMTFCQNASNSRIPVAEAAEEDSSEPATVLAKTAKRKSKKKKKKNRSEEKNHVLSDVNGGTCHDESEVTAEKHKPEENLIVFKNELEKVKALDTTETTKKSKKKKKEKKKKDSGDAEVANKDKEESVKRKKKRKSEISVEDFENEVRESSKKSKKKRKFSEK